MQRALYTAASGMAARELAIEVIANNLSNLSTTGYKARRAEFQDLLYQTLRAAGAPTSPTTRAPGPLEVGLGVRPLATPALHTQGEMKLTANPLDIAIQGRGFLPVSLPSGEVAYTRAGNLRLSAEGELVTPEGYPLEPALSIPPEATEVQIGADGSVSVRVAGDFALQPVGQIELAMFPNPAGLESLGRNLHAPTPGSGEPLQVAPGEQGSGTIAQGYLEGSNVDVVFEFVEMIQSQRGYEAIARVLRSADEMYQAVNNATR